MYTVVVLFMGILNKQTQFFCILSGEVTILFYWKITSTCIYMYIHSQINFSNPA